MKRHGLPLSVAALAFLGLWGCPSSLPIPETGSFNVTATWTPGQVAAPVVLATLTSPSGAVIDLPFGVTDGEASCRSAAVPTGNYILSLELRDGPTLATGVLDLVAINRGESTAQAYALAAAVTTGTLVVKIAKIIQGKVLPVTIKGVPLTLKAGSTATATAGVSDGTKGVSYAWYLNGAPQQVGGQTCTFGTGLAPGYHYRLDVTGFVAEPRGGSTGASFDVLP